MKKNLILVFVLLLINSIHAHSQGVTAIEDSLYKVLANQNQKDTIRLNVLIQLIGEVRFHDLATATELALEALDLSKETKSQMHLGKSYYYLSILNYMKGFLNIALEYAQKSTAIFEAEKHNLRISSGYNLLGVIHTDLRKDDEAISNIRRSLEIVEKIGDGIGQVQALANIGTVYLNRGERKMAREYFIKALNVSQKYKYDGNEAELNLNLAGIEDDFLESEKFYNKAEKGFVKANKPNGIANVYLSKAIKYVKIKKYREALVYNKKALEIISTSEFNLLLAKGHYEMANTYLKLNDLTKAENSASLAKNVAIKNKNNDITLKSYEILIEIFERRGNSKAAIANFKAYDKFKESIYNQKEAQFIAENEAKYQNKKKEEALSQKEIELADQKSAKNQIIVWASFLLLGSGAVLGTLFYKQQKRRIISENKLLIKNIEAQTLKDKEELKSTFFANISHEFRTPLTLIISPLKELYHGHFNGNISTLHSNILKNGERLLGLVNQLLDLSKLESGNLILEMQKGDINEYIKSLGATFQSLAEVRDISFEIKAPEGNILAEFDKGQMHKIISNLLSNAFKFTQDLGKVTLEVCPSEREIIVKVIDNGLGIEKEAIAHVFNRFYQSDNTKNSHLMGSGIGLALTKELVELHKGRIEVQSQINEGSIFSVCLPILKNESTLEIFTEILNSRENEWLNRSNNEQKVLIILGKMPLLLVVEDNMDVTQLINESLQNEFEIIAAPNGKIGLQMAQEYIPDAIISDVMMPEMNGYAFCEATKTNRLTSHIPIIMLTALADQKDKLLGIENGADAYLSKPFEISELKLRVNKLIELRENLKQSYSKSINLRPEEIKVSSLDQQFMQTINDVLEINLGNENFGVSEFANELSLSKKQLNKKLKAILNQSANEVIRNYRLEKAHQLLTAKAANPTEASYRFGFSSPAYFSKCFSDRYGYTPSSLLFDALT